MNFQKDLDTILQSFNQTHSLLLHSCCAPCSSYVISYLSEYFEITVFYYNPNIYPREEYEKRKEEQIRFVTEFKAKNKVSFLDCEYNSDEFFTVAKGLENEPERGARCNECFLLRLSKTAKEAEKRNFDFFATTLTVSPHKNAEEINRIGSSIPCKSKYLPSDFKKREGYKKSIKFSEEYGLYRQNYCGCVFSQAEYNNKK
ncbi:MAG: hypothetical protein DBX47_02875 [Clostridiales bacterium]|nr:MAG: hypothetical protein DBX47_02875 [Clostridiales bacterium]